MLNLLPIDEKKRIFKLYRFRITIVVVWLGVVAFLVAILSLIPIYIIARAEQSTLNQELTQLKNQPEFRIEEGLQKDIKEINQKLNAFSGDNAISLSQQVLLPLLHVLPSDIHLSEIFYSAPGETPAGITLVGVADTRTALQSFADDLEKSDAFMNVELPISDFVKNQNVDFRISAFLEGQ